MEIEYKNLKLSKEEVKVIAQALIAKTGSVFDGCAFEECEHFLDENQVAEIVNEIAKICNSTIKRLDKKHKLNLCSVNTTKDIIEEVLFE